MAMPTARIMVVGGFIVFLVTITFPVTIINYFVTFLVNLGIDFFNIGVTIIEVIGQAFLSALAGVRNSIASLINTYIIDPINGVIQILNDFAFTIPNPIDPNNPLFTLDPFDFDLFTLLNTNYTIPFDLSSYKINHKVITIIDPPPNNLLEWIFQNFNIGYPISV